MSELRSIAEFKKSCVAVTKKLRRIDQFYPCKNCGKLVYRSPSQVRQAHNIFCGVECKTVFYKRDYQDFKNCFKPVNFGHALTVSFYAGKALISGVDPWTLAAKEARFR